MNAGKRVALVFPGQGSQWVGMGREFAEAFPEARQVFEESDAALGEDLSRVCFYGPEEDLQQTFYSQPAILACSMAIWRVVEARSSILPVAAAGHSLGEYSALVAAGALELGDAVRLTRARALCMDKAANAGGRTGMLVILGLERDVVGDIAAFASQTTGKCASIANYNCPGQVVVGGHVEALEAAAELARQRGARRARMLPISVASHTPLLAEAAEAFAEVLADIPLRRAAFPVVGNAFARPLIEVDDIREELRLQLVTGLDWPRCVSALRELGADTLLEIGPRAVVSGLCKRLDDPPRTMAIASVDDLSTFDQVIGESVSDVS